MTLLKNISALIFLVLATTCSPPPCGLGVRGRHYGSSIHQFQVNSSPQQGGDQIAKEFQPDADPDYSDTDFENGQIQSRDKIGTRNEDTKPFVKVFKKRVQSAPITTFRQWPSGYLRRRPGHFSTNSTGSRNEGEYGYNYQGGNGDVQIHQHIHEYVFNNRYHSGTLEDACSVCGGCRNGCRGGRCC